LADSRRRKLNEVIKIYLPTFKRGKGEKEKEKKEGRRLT